MEPKTLHFNVLIEEKVETKKCYTISGDNLIDILNDYIKFKKDDLAELELFVERPYGERTYIDEWNLKLCLKYKDNMEPIETTHEIILEDS